MSVVPARLPFSETSRKSLGPRHAQATKQVALDKHGLETLESGKYQTRRNSEGQGICHLVCWGVMGVAPAQPWLSISVIRLGHISDVPKSLVQKGLVHCGKMGSGTEKLLKYTVIQGMSWEGMYKPSLRPRTPSPQGIFFHDPRGCQQLCTELLCFTPKVEACISGLDSQWVWLRPL